MGLLLSSCCRSPWGAQTLLVSLRQDSGTPFVLGGDLKILDDWVNLGWAEDMT